MTICLRRAGAPPWRGSAVVLPGQSKTAAGRLRAEDFARPSRGGNVRSGGEATVDDHPSAGEIMVEDQTSVRSLAAGDGYRVLVSGCGRVGVRRPICNVTHGSRTSRPVTSSGAGSDTTPRAGTSSLALPPASCRKDPAAGGAGGSCGPRSARPVTLVYGRPCATHERPARLAGSDRPRTSPALAPASKQKEQRCTIGSSTRSVSPGLTARHPRRELAPDVEQAFHRLQQGRVADGALPRRAKQLIAVAVAHAAQCPYCIRSHTEGALRGRADGARSWRRSGRGRDARRKVAHRHRLGSDGGGGAPMTIRRP